MAGGNLETKLKDYFCTEENAKMDKKVLQELCKLLRQFYKPTARTYSSDNKTIKYLPTTHRFTQWYWSKNFRKKWNKRVGILQLTQGSIELKSGWRKSRD